MKIQMRLARFPFTALLLLPLAACATQPDRPAQDVNIDTIDTVVASSTDLLLADIRERDSAEDLWVAYAGLDNKSSVDVGSAKAEIDEIIGEILVNSKSFRNISGRLVTAARRAASITRVEDLTLAEPLERFLGVLRKEGRAPEYLMFGTLTTADQGATRRFRLTLEMIRTSDGDIIAKRSGTFIRN